MEKCKTFLDKNEKWIYGVWLLLFLGFHLIVVANHETWRDEAQAYALAKHLDLSSLFAQLASEGHPILWFLITKAAIGLGMPYRAYSYLSLAFTTAALAVFLYKAPFSMLTKGITMCSIIFTFFNAVVARSYCVVLLLIMLLAVAFEKKEKNFYWLCLGTALLFQTHIIVVGLALALAVYLVVTAMKNKSWKQGLGALLPMGSFCFMLMELRQGGQAQNEYIHVTPVSMVSNLFSVKGFKNFYSNVYHGYNLFPLRVLKGLVLILVPVLIIGTVYFLIQRKVTFLKLWKEIRKNFWFWFVTAMSMGAYWAIILCISYCAHAQHGSLFFMLVIFVLWMAQSIYEYKTDAFYRFLYRGLIGLLALTVPCIVYMGCYDITNAFSSSKDMAQYMVENLEAGSVVIARNDPVVDAVVMYLEDGLERAGKEGQIRFVDQITLEDFYYFDWTRWGQNYDYSPWNVSEDDFDGDVYLLDGSLDAQEDWMELVYYVDRDIHRNENYYLFKVTR